MSKILVKIKQYSKRAALIASLSLAVFMGAFYLVNLDFSFLTGKTTQITGSIQKTQTDDELQKRIGSTEVGSIGFVDWARANNLTGANIYDADADGDGLANYLEYTHGTDPNNVDTDKDGFSDKQEIANGYDPDAPGDSKPMVNIQIEKIGVEAPMVWSLSNDEKNMLSELENGVSHFFKTAAPGQNGNAVISGHSSNYIWAKGNFNHIFKNLNDLEQGDTIIVRSMQKNGKIIVNRYAVGDKFVTVPDDERIFAETQNSSLTLSTCWPLGTNFKRLIVKAELMK
ncbi:MAG: sortase [Candidatus Moranbacteria bacterium]|nr:sortase [Candidatus Moranbacteria bacterium]